MKPSSGHVSFEKRFLEHCLKKRFFKKNERLLLAVSGGVDSMALAHVLLAIQPAINCHLGLAHLHHGLRGQAATRDQAFVKKFAAQHHLDFYTKNVDALSFSKKHKTSLEESCRILRYRFLEQTALKYGYDCIITAHHAGDQAETVLLRLIKGAGWAGLSGVREKRALVVRPLLDFTKEDILAYAKKQKIVYRTDATNRDPRFLRNRVRRHLLPLLKKHYDPQIEKHLVQLARIAADTEAWLQSGAQRLFKRIGRVVDGKIVLEIDSFKKYFATQQHAVLSKVAEFLSIRLDYDKTARIVDLAIHGHSGKKLLFGKWECLRTQHTLVFQPRMRPQKPAENFVQTGQTFFFGKWRCEISEMAAPVLKKIKLGRDPFVEYADASKITGQLVIRSWQNGDVFYPLGMPHAKKLSNFFTDAKIALPDKHSIPILCERKNGRDQIIWICGLRLDDRYKLTAATQRILKLECRPNDHH